MKYLITESQLDRTIFRYLDNQDFIKIKIGDKVYFVNSEDDERAHIRYDRKYGWCGIYYKLIKEISNFFSLDESEAKQVIGRWVENTLQMMVTGTYSSQSQKYIFVENTLRMRVEHAKPFN